MTLGEAQREFSRCLAILILRINDTPGYGCAMGEGKRSDEQAEINAMGFTARNRLADYIASAWPQLAEKIRNNGKADGIRMSGHGNKLAQDLDLFKDGEYQFTSEAHAQFGEYWKTLHPLARWGGDFKPKPDGNHYSFEWNGIK